MLYDDAKQMIILSLDNDSLYNAISYDDTYFICADDGVVLNQEEIVVLYVYSGWQDLEVDTITSNSTVFSTLQYWYKKLKQNPQEFERFKNLYEVEGQIYVDPEEFGWEDPEPSYI